MERLTKKALIELKNGEEIVACNYKDEDCNDYCMYGYCKWNDKALKKLKELEDLEEQGLLIRLPVAEGSTVYKLGYVYECEFDYDDCPMIPSYICEECEKCEHEHKNYRVEETKFKQQLIAVLGKTVFLTEEEAEAALAEMG